MKSHTEFEWWRLNTTSDSGTDEVPEQHREALEQTATRVIADRTAQGFVEGELHEVVFDTDDESDSGKHYRGYWRLVRSA